MATELQRLIQEANGLHSISRYALKNKFFTKMEVDTDEDKRVIEVMIICSDGSVFHSTDGSDCAYAWELIHEQIDRTLED